MVNDREPREALELFAVTAPGLEAICAAELGGLGIDGSAGEGGVSWRGDRALLYRANLELRTASRIVARLGSFRARTFPELERHAARLPWGRLLEPGTAVSLRVTSRKSRLYHGGAVAQRIARVLADQLAAAVDVGRDDDDDDGGAAQLVVVRFLRDVCTISIDSSGTLLHQRGYRQAIAKAPLRETIAAALLLGSGWRGSTALLDPLCGSGVIAIEAALLARRIPPGLAAADRAPRAYAFQAWPGYDSVRFDAIVQAARARILPAAGVSIVATDRSAGAISAARSNAERAGVMGDVVTAQRPLSELQAPAAEGHLVTNPPYGVRVGERSELAPLYAALGRVAMERLPRWKVVLLAAEPRLAAATGLPLHELFATRNGGIPVRVLCAGCGTAGARPPSQGMSARAGSAADPAAADPAAGDAAADSASADAATVDPARAAGYNSGNTDTGAQR
jgi:putative N6-adenine-specific DNA methylase